MFIPTASKHSEPSARLFTNRVIRVVAGVACLCTVGFASPTWAATQQANWTGGTGFWNTPGNWSGAVVPDNGADTYNVFIDNGDLGTASIVELDADITIDSLTIDQGDRLTIVNDISNNFALTILQDPSRALSGAIVNNGTLEMLVERTMISNPEFTGPKLIAQGNVTLSGSGSLLMHGQSSGRLFLRNNTTFTNAAGHTIRGVGGVGNFSEGTMVGFVNDGTVIAQIDQVTVNTVDDEEELKLVPLAFESLALGLTNNGMMMADAGGGVLVFEGGQVFNNGIIQALDGGSVELWETTEIYGGTLASTGSGLILIDTSEAPFTSVALSGVTIAAGTTVEHASSARDHTAAIDGSVTNNGLWRLKSASLLNEHTITFKNAATLSGTGTIRMTEFTDGNSIFADDSVMTQSAGHTISGTGHLLNGTGGMINQGTVLADLAGGMTIRPGTQGFINDNGGTLQASGDGSLIIQEGDLTNASGGSVVIDSDTLLLLTGGSVFTNNDGGTVSGSGIINATNGAFINNGTVSPGASPGVLSVTGSYTQGGTGRLQIEIEAADFDRLAVTAGVSLDGTLEVMLDPGFTPQYNDTFRVLSAATRTGRFAQYTGLNVNSDMTLAPVYDHNSLVGLSLVAAIPGDANLDGIVNGLDLLAWQSNLFSGNQWTHGDFNHDGLVNGQDLLVWQSHLFNSIPQPGPGASPPPASTVPEPSTMAIFGLGLALSWRRGTRR